MSTRRKIQVAQKKMDRLVQERSCSLPLPAFVIVSVSLFPPTFHISCAVVLVPSSTVALRCCRSPHLPCRVNWRLRGLKHSTAQCQHYDLSSVKRRMIKRKERKTNLYTDKGMFEACKALWAGHPLTCVFPGVDSRTPGTIYVSGALCGCRAYGRFGEFSLQS